jgi:hypothetical protein
LDWYKAIDLASCMLGWLVEQNKEARQSARQVG